MDVEQQPRRKGLRLLAAHLRNLDPETKPARRRLEERMGVELARRLVAALVPHGRRRPAA